MSYSTSVTLPSALIRDIYARMLLARIVDDFSWKAYTRGDIDFVASCRGHEAAQVVSALCIEVGKDFTLPYYRDLGVVLTLGMSPYDVFRTYFQARQQASSGSSEKPAHMRHWGYHKHNIVTGPAPVATQLLHAAGIAFSCKLSSRISHKAPVVTVAYCGDGATTEPDFLEGLRFAALHQLPVVFICEQDCSSLLTDRSHSSCTDGLALPAGLTHQRLDGSDVVSVYSAMSAAMEQARAGLGPSLLEMHVARLDPVSSSERVESTDSAHRGMDPLVQCQRLLLMQDAWDDDWAQQLSTRISVEVERALHDAMRDTLQNS